MIWGALRLREDEKLVCCPRQPNPTQTQNTLKRMRFCTPSAIKAYEAMLDEVREANAHLSEADLDVNLREARDAYCRELREKDLARARWVPS